MKKATVSFVVGTSILVLSFALGIFGMTSLLGQKAKSTLHQEWMKAYGDDRTISSLSIPGSHDTLALYGIGDLTGQCQALPLEEQLNIGVRFLDIRLKNENNTLKAVHGIVDERETFNTTLKTMTKFLKAHPSESLFVSIKEETKPSGSNQSFEATLKKYIVEEDWYLGSSMPKTLGECRGKMVLISRYFDSTIGITAGHNWGENTSFALDEETYVQDWYKVDDIEKKKEAIANCFASDAPYRINFFSGYVPGGFPPSYAPSVAHTINPWAKQYLTLNKPKGIVVLDFVTSELTDALLNIGGWYQA